MLRSFLLCSFFWTWHIGNSTTYGYQPNPMWNYKVSSFLPLSISLPSLLLLHLQAILTSPSSSLHSSFSSPALSFVFQLGLSQGWSPKDPREATGHCASLGVTAAAQPDGTFPSWHTGGAGAGVDVKTRNAWPPASFADVNAAQVRRSVPSCSMMGDEMRVR